MIRLENISVSYDGKNKAVDDLSLAIKKAEIVGLIGSSGSGKSSLLKTINRLVDPESGRVIIGGQDISRLKDRDLRLVRREIAMVFQDYNLVERSLVLDNVLMGRLGYKSGLRSIVGSFSHEEYEMARKALENVGLEDKIFSRAGQLSGGQKQRVAIAKALCQRPKIILADEPVASLDIQTARLVMEYFRRVNEKKSITLVVSLHDVGLAREYCTRIIALYRGRLIFDGKPGEINDELLKKIYL